MADEVINVLLVEKDLSAGGFVRNTLSECSNSIRFCTETADNISDAIGLIEEKNFDIVLLGVELPDSSGPDFVREIRKLKPYMPIVLITNSGDEEAAVEAIKNGADDYLVKGKIFKDVLSRSIRYSIERKKERQRSLEEIQSVNRELKDFAYIVSHDLKAPLRGIKTIAGWISADYADKLDDEGKEQMEMLMARVERMHNLIDGVLSYSRIGRIREQMVEVDLNVLVSEVIDTISPPDNFSITIEGVLPTIVFERIRIMQVFQNLLGNAVKYIDKPQGKIKIVCRDEGDFWEFGIQDNGIGIESEHFERIFQIFQTLSSKDEVESTGVGLTVVKKIVEFYGGKIWVRSQPGTGSTFYFTLPKQREETKNAELQTNIAC
jgi:signal transduction histidine kinase